jgi:glycosyltransferase involved in cell wall biosynthesis
LMSQEAYVSIIVPVRNAERTIDTTLSYLTGLDYPNERLEIILADGGSTDGTVDAIKRWQASHQHIKLVEVPNCRTPGHARNAALKVAKGEFVLFTDGDCAPNTDWVRQILQPFFMDEKIGGVGGELLTLRTDPDNETEDYCEQVRFLSVSGRCGVTESGYFPCLEAMAPHEVNGGDCSPFFATANAAFRREAIEAIGGHFWDEPTGEDVDFSLRVLMRGYRLYFAKEAVVKHMHRVSLDSFMKQWYGYGYGHPLLVREHARDGLEIVIQADKPRFLHLPSPIKGVVHLGAFHLAHLSLLASVGSGLAALATPAALPLFGASLGLFTLSAAAYFAPCLKLKPRNRLLTWCKIRYLTNWAFIRGALDGSRRFGTICVEPSW